MQHTIYVGQVTDNMSWYDGAFILLSSCSSEYCHQFKNCTISKQVEYPDLFTFNNWGHKVC